MNTHSLQSVYLKSKFNPKIEILRKKQATDEYS